MHSPDSVWADVSNETQTTYNKVIRGVRAVAERAKALLKKNFAALQRVSLSPTRIGAIELISARFS
jgi:hypothetical protein